MRRTLAALAALCILILLLASPPALAADSNYYQLLINKQYPLGYSYQPENLVSLNQYMKAGASVKMTEQAAAALGEMVRAMQADGISDIYGSSGYRSYNTQKHLHQNKIAAYRNQGYSSDEAARRAGMSVAPPGASEHQSGMAIDLTASENNHGLTSSFGETQAGRWLAEHCWQYGYILRYTADKTDITGYIYEPWHFRYVGKPHAEYITKNKLCLEEYIALLAEERLLTFTAADGINYAIYYNEYNNSDSLPGEMLGVSAAYAGAGGCVITARPPDTALFDLSGHWSEAEVRELHALSLISGYPDNTFRPNRDINRAELMTLINNVYQLLFGVNQTAIEGEPAPIGAQAAEGAAEEAAAAAAESGIQPVDANPAQYYYPALLANCEHGLLPPEMLVWRDGLPYFYPDQAVLRREAARALAPLFAALPETPAARPAPHDMLYADQELARAVQLLTDYGVVQGDLAGNFNPEAHISRAELSAMLNRIIAYFLGNAETDDADERD